MDALTPDYDAPLYGIGVAATMAGMHQQTLRQYDRLGLVVPMRTADVRARDGQNVVLTIDATAQYIVEDELAEAREREAVLRVLVGEISDDLEDAGGGLLGEAGLLGDRGRWADRGTDRGRPGFWLGAGHHLDSAGIHFHWRRA